MRLWKKIGRMVDVRVWASGNLYCALCVPLISRPLSCYKIMNRSELPKFHQFMAPLLQVLKERGELARPEAYAAVIAKMNLTPEQVELSHQSNGKSIVEGRISWAASYLKQAGAVLMPRRSVFALGKNAPELLDLNRSIAVADIKDFPEWQAYQAQKLLSNEAEGIATATEWADAAPEELIEAGFSQLNQALIAELRERISTIRPEAFERLVLRVLAALGYGGGNVNSMQGVPRGPDGGIDGRINEDKLGLDQIYIQAKRYADNSVGRPTVQSFVGAMTGGGCKKGVFVTSSSFTNEARAFAADLRDQKLVLIDGGTFAKLMIENDIGIQVKDVYRVAKVDQDFFSEDE